MKPRPRTPAPSQPVVDRPAFSARLEKPVYGGACLARVEGKAVFVPLTLPGEAARVRIVEDKGSFANAEVEALLTAAPERTAPRCAHFGACGGCNYQHANYETQLAMKQAILRETLERAGVAVPEQVDTLSAEPWGYRNRIRLAFDHDGQPGYRGRRSHAVVAIRECPIAAPLLLEAAQQAAELLREARVTQNVRELALFANESGSALALTLVVESGTRLHLDSFAQALRERVPVLKGAELQIEERKGGRVQFPRTVARWGAPSIVYRAGGQDYRVDHGSFFQVNQRVLESFVERIVDVHKGELAWDLFAGVGLFARQLAERFERVVAVESAPMAVQSLEANLAGTGGEAVRASTLDFLRRNYDVESPELIVVDPPRAGLGAEVCTLLAEVAAPTIVSVSCDPATLARDLRMLTQSGYRIESLALADLFPQTFHLETVAVLRRA